MEGNGSGGSPKAQWHDQALNIIEPDHLPHVPAFEDHDYAFYSWINPRFGGQRLDHTLVGVGADEIRTCAYDHTTRSDELSDHAAMLTTIGL